MPLMGPSVFSTGVAADDRPTFGQLKADIARPINPDDQGVLAAAGDAINQAIRNYNRFDWPWDILTTDITLASGTDTYALPQNFKKECAAYILDSGRPYRRQQYVPFVEFMRSYSQKADGEPTVYTFQNVHETGQITVWRRPLSAYNYRVWYYRRSTIGRRDEEVIDMSDESVGYIMAEAWAELIKRYPGSNYLGSLADARSEARRARNELVAMAVNRGDPVSLI